MLRPMMATQQPDREAARALRAIEKRLKASPESIGRSAGSRWAPKLLRPYKTTKVKHKREGRSYRCKLFRPHVLAEVIQLARPRESSRYAVNIGAGDGVSCNDPVYPLFAEGWPGVAIEGAPTPELAANLPDAVRILDDTFVLPSNVAQLLKESNCPDAPGFLKTDVDGYDGPILEAILQAGFRPLVIQAEVQPEFPPPIEFAVQYDPEYRVFGDDGKVTGFYGASFAYMLNLTRPFGYRLAYMDFVTPWTHDVTLVHEDFTDIAVALFGSDVVERTDRERFLAHPPGHSHFKECGIRTTLSWRHRTDWEALLEDIRTACDDNNLHKHNGHEVPYHLAVGPH